MVPLLGFSFGLILTSEVEGAQIAGDCAGKSEAAAKSAAVKPEKIQPFICCTLLFRVSRESSKIAYPKAQRPTIAIFRRRE